MLMESIYNYQSAKSYLTDFINLSKKNTDFSLRKWSKFMGLKSHAHLVMILQGKRKLSLKHVPFLAKGLNLSSEERLFFQALIQFENAITPEEKDLCKLWLSDLVPHGEFRSFEIDEYSVLSNWIHMAILAMTHLKNPPKNAIEINELLGEEATLYEVNSAIERLVNLELLKFENCKYISTYKSLNTKNEVASKGARNYHKQVAELGIEAIETQSLEQREFQSFALCVSKKNIPIIKEKIRKFRAELRELNEFEPGDQVYQTVIQFFQLTKNPSEIVLKEDQGAGSALSSKVTNKKKEKKYENIKQN